MNVCCNRVILYTLETVPSQSIVVSRVIVIKRVRYNEVRLYCVCYCCLECLYVVHIDSYYIYIKIIYIYIYIYIFILVDRKLSVHYVYVIAMIIIHT